MRRFHRTHTTHSKAGRANCSRWSAGSILFVLLTPCLTIGCGEALTGQMNGSARHAPLMLILPALYSRIVGSSSRHERGVLILSTVMATKSCHKVGLAATAYIRC